MFCRVSGKWPTLEALFDMTSAFASILKQISYLRSGFCHCSWGALLTVASISACTLVSNIPGPAECAERLNLPPLPYGKSWRVKSKAQVRHCKSPICRSLTPLKSPPSTPAHSAWPAQNHHGADFDDFHLALAGSSEMQKPYFKNICLLYTSPSPRDRG